ncbi:MAG: DUF2147 domain-containing protein [Gammaproteobacteria bacterium]|nr:DUF2147 domain-containing protein [Gammaproteobacteria bacterium]MDH3372556.1 DUF2147 domain-containing protein [Gammaproteobacteria bacterium]MDH3408302.1 DUF2147 domain-containing protein [Gammaproteobacteria bacterium]MDH3553899.1 DUF2147 domain-containing protein [Gammaproteobacteria bacterium]
MNPLQRLIVSALPLLSFACWGGQGDVAGRWLSGDGDGWIEIQLVGDSLTGMIAGSPNTRPGDPPRYDDKNPDPDLRDRPLDGMVIMRGFKYVGDGRWTGGTIYDPNSGKTYKCTLTQVDADTLKVRGYIGVSLFGRSDTWTRASQ